APPSGSTVHDDSDTSCYATEDEQDTQMHLGPNISIKEHLKKDKDDESLRKWKEQLLGSVDVSQMFVMEVEYGEQVKAWLESEKDIRLGDSKAAEIEILNVFQLLTAKPVVYLNGNGGPPHRDFSLMEILPGKSRRHAI
nr:Rho GDP-dissociation inhibitor 1-like [Tanacetum cinerariifolium]